MLKVCEACGAWLDEAVVEDGAAVCTACGHRRPFLRLPLFQVTGASGAGKTTAFAGLVGALPEYVVLEQDIFWRPGLRTDLYRRNWLRLAMNIQQGGRSVVLGGSHIPEHDEVPERAWFSEIHYLALVCDGELIAERLRARPPWRGSREQIEEMQRFNAWFKANAGPSLTLLDTSSATPAETVAAAAAWVRATADRRPPPP